MHPAFPDIVGQWAAQTIDEKALEERVDPPALSTLNEFSPIEHVIDVLLLAAGEQELAETRVW